MNNNILEAIKTRRSCRSYKEEQIKDEELNAILEAGTWAASAHGKQDAVIVAVTNTELCNELRALNAEVLGSNADPYYAAPCIILVFVSKDNMNGVKDGSLVLGNMMLAAHSLNIGSCWINRAEMMFSSEKGHLLMDKMQIDKSLVGVGSLSIGYVAGELKAPKPRKDNYFKVIK